MFNTLKYAKMLEDVGFSRQQAETSIGILVEIMEDKLATKQDLKGLEERMNHAITQVEFATRQDIKNLDERLGHAISQVESKLTIRMGTMLAASIAILTTVLKLT